MIIIRDLNTPFSGVDGTRDQNQQTYRWTEQYQPTGTTTFIEPSTQQHKTFAKIYCTYLKWRYKTSGNRLRKCKYTRYTYQL